MQVAGQDTVMSSACDTAMRRNEVDEEFRAEQVAAARRARGVAAAALPFTADQGPSYESAAARPDPAGRVPAPLDAGPMPAHMAREVLRALVDPEVPLHMLMASGKQATPDALGRMLGPLLETSSVNVCLTIAMTACSVILLGVELYDVLTAAVL